MRAYAPVLLIGCAAVLWWGAGSNRTASGEDEAQPRLPVVAGFPQEDGTTVWPHLDTQMLLARPEVSAAWRGVRTGVRIVQGRRVHVFGLVPAYEGAEGETPATFDYVDPATGLVVGGRRAADAAPAEAVEAGTCVAAR